MNGSTVMVSGLRQDRTWYSGTGLWLGRRLFVAPGRAVAGRHVVPPRRPPGDRRSRAGDLLGRPVGSGAARGARRSRRPTVETDAVRLAHPDYPADVNNLAEQLLTAMQAGDPSALGQLVDYAATAPRRRPATSGPAHLEDLPDAYRNSTAKLVAPTRVDLYLLGDLRLKIEF